MNATKDRIQNQEEKQLPLCIRNVGVSERKKKKKIRKKSKYQQVGNGAKCDHGKGEDWQGGVKS